MEQISDTETKIYLADPYTERSVLVYGDDIDDFRSEFEKIGGKRGWGYTPEELEGEKVSGFIFSITRRDQVIDLFDKIYSGQMQRRQRTTRVKPTPKQSPSRYQNYPASPKKSPVRAVPKGTRTVSLPRRGPEMQTITYNIIKPSKGMKLIISFDTKDGDTAFASDLNAVVSEIPESEYNSGEPQGRAGPGGIIQLIEISLVEDPSEIYELGIVNGEWQILGTSDVHKIKFI